MRACEIGVNTTFTALNVAASVQGRINLVIGDEHTDLCHFRHIGGVFPSRQVKVLQSVPNCNGFVVAESKNITVYLVGIHKSRIVGGNLLTESRVFQVLG